MIRLSALSFRAAFYARQADNAVGRSVADSCIVLNWIESALTVLLRGSYSHHSQRIDPNSDLTIIPNWMMRAEVRALRDVGEVMLRWTRQLNLVARTLIKIDNVAIPQIRSMFG
jgi:hypothetical protein